MTGLTLNYGDAWGLNSHSSSYTISNSVREYIHEQIERGITLAEYRGFTRSEGEDMIAVCLNDDSKLPKTLQFIKRNDTYRAKVLDSFKKDVDEKTFINKSYTVSIFSEEDIEKCKEIGVTPEQMIDFIKSLY
jgi:hypothetical protein